MSGMQNMVNKLSTDFSLWLQEMGYLDEDGVLTVGMREANATFLQSSIVEHKNNIKKHFIALAKDLWRVYKEQYWVELGFSNFEEWLYSPEVDISKSQGYGLKNIGACLEEGLLDEEWLLKVGPSKAMTLLPKLKEGKDVEEWKVKAEELTALDLMDEVSGREIVRYSGMGLMPALIEEIRRIKPALWESEVKLHVRTV